MSEFLYILCEDRLKNLPKNQEVNFYNCINLGTSEKCSIIEGDILKSF